MTATRTSDHRRIVCDEPGCTAATVGPLSHPLARVRAFLQRQGWWYVPGHPTTGPGRDLCPQHAAPAGGDRG